MKVGLAISNGLSWGHTIAVALSLRLNDLARQRPRNNARHTVVDDSCLLDSLFLPLLGQLAKGNNRTSMRFLYIIWEYTVAKILAVRNVNIPETL